jgi:RNA polymerase-binding transcription factor DksA
MRKGPRKREKSDAMRIRDSGTGKLDHGGARAVAEERGQGPPQRARAEREEKNRAESLEEARTRLESERSAAIEQLRELGIATDAGDGARDAATAIPLDEGDQAQASERQDMSFVTRERLANRINRLTVALQRIHEGTYGTCDICGADIEPRRLAAIPEVTTCLQCQERLEQSASPEAAA